MRPAKKHRNSFTLLIGIFFITTLRCGGYDHRVPHDGGGSFVPSEWYKGTVSGRGIVLDRNGNIRESFSVIRDCTRENELRGTCKEKIHYDNANITEEREFRWSIHYYDVKEPSVVIEGIENHNATRLSGEVSGRALYLNGNDAIPLDRQNRILSVDQYLQRLKGNSFNNVMEVKKYYSLLFWRMGEVHTLWWHGESPDKLSFGSVKL